jgi:glycosyltransferase involved in cell wall biosynthesis
MKRALLTGNILTTQRYGGVSRYIIELATGISKSPEWCVKIGSPLYQNDYLYENRKALNHRGVHISKYRRGFLNLNEWLVNLIHRDLLSNSDIIHETHYNYTRLRKGRKGRVSTFYDMMTESLWSNSEAKEVKAKTAEHSDRIIAISESTKTDIVRHLGTDPDKIEVIYLSSSIVPVKERLSLVPDPPYLLWVGNRMGYKNFDQFVVALGRSNAFKSDFALVCAGGPPLNAEEQEMLADQQIGTERVIHCRPNEQELASLYSNAETLIYPSKYEGFGLPPLEAMTCNCPVIASNSTSIPEITGDAAILVDPDQPDDIAAAIDRVCGDEGLRHQLARRGIHRAAQFSWQRCTDSHLELYDSLS